MSLNHVVGILRIQST